mmetsp:Transcript_115607/g.299748  ORF Transcript_115607/g.299748 Transcript_115607/m.299748 type:complete len:85 (+) Transcript_115607:1506-1760(+)
MISADSYKLHGPSKTPRGRQRGRQRTGGGVQLRPPKAVKEEEEEEEEKATGNRPRGMRRQLVIGSCLRSSKISWDLTRDCLSQT